LIFCLLRNEKEENQNPVSENEKKEKGSSLSSRALGREEQVLVGEKEKKRGKKGWDVAK